MHRPCRHHAHRFAASCGPPHPGRTKAYPNQNHGLIAAIGGGPQRVSTATPHHGRAKRMRPKVCEGIVSSLVWRDRSLWLITVAVLAMPLNAAASVSLVFVAVVRRVFAVTLQCAHPFTDAAQYLSSLSRRTTKCPSRSKSVRGWGRSARHGT